jgi:AraC-like DNA-binding protein
VSARILEPGFQEQYGMAPTRYLRHVRLERACEDLRQHNGTVAEIAYYWGFADLGRFARESFGEMPAATLAAARSGS